MEERSVKCMVFHSPRDNGREIYIQEAAKNANRPVHQIANPTYFPTIPGTKHELSGRFVEQSFDVAEGEVVKVFLNLNPGYGQMKLNGSIFLRVRKGAAHHRLHIKSIEHVDLTRQHFEIEGPFDIIEVEEALALGVKILPAFRQLAAPIIRQKLIKEDIIIHEEDSPAVRYTEREIGEGDNKKKITVKKRRRSVEI